MPASRTVTAAVIVIGNEILSGRTHDANLPYLARSLNTVGIRVMEARVIADDEGAIVSAVNACRAAYDHVFTTGGIGPTHDDITSAAVARAFNVALVRDPQAVSLLTHHYAAADLNEARLKMAEVPEGASLIDNPVSAAPGFRIDNVWVLPGVPRILQAMVDGLTAGLKGGDPVLSRTISAFTTESGIASPLADVQQQHGATEIGSYPFVRSGRFGVSLVVRSTDAAALDAAAAAVTAMLRDAGIEPLTEDAPAA
ncbi:MAG: competence/damage-inducible protein A [Rhodospirillales bacterium]|nr:competence/damage-inducible protein A [Rhodospirillales bacterium]